MGRNRRDSDSKRDSNVVIRYSHRPRSPSSKYHRSSRTRSRSYIRSRKPSSGVHFKKSRSKQRSPNILKIEKYVKDADIPK
jgi:hypothetical protein